MAYSKLFSSIVHSSLWTEEDHVRLLFVTLLAIADREGYVYGSRMGLERLANIDYDDDDRNPWQVLTDPDSDSSDLMRNPENQGRRIEEVPGGFRILNYSYYRSLRNEDDRREQNREAQRTFRATHPSIKRKSAKENHRNPRIGYVYYATDGRHIKIGYSANPWSRIQELKVGCPTIRLLAIERAPESKEGERHTLFSEYRVVGEWFKNEAPISAHIESLLRNVSQDKPSANQVSQDKQSPSASASYLSVLKEGVRGRFEQWVQVRKAMGKKPKNWDSMFLEQAEWLQQFTEAEQMEVLSASIRNNWQGLFEPKPSKGKRERELEPAPTGQAYRIYEPPQP